MTTDKSDVPAEQNGSAKISEISSTSEAESAKDSEARAAGQAVVRKFAMEAVWPSNDENRTKNLLTTMAIEMAALYGRSMDSVSLEDISRAQKSIEKLCVKVGVHKVRYNKIKSAVDLYQTSAIVMDYISHVYWVGNLFFGNFGPLIRKLGLQISGMPLARAAGVWLAGQAILELYWDPEGFQQEAESPQSYHPLFDSFTLDQYREIAVFMDIDARVAWNEEKLQKEILGVITESHHNKVTALWSDAPKYRAVLVQLCEALKVPEYSANDSEELLEERIVQRVLAESVKNLSPAQLDKFKAAIKLNGGDDYWGESLSSTAYLGGLVAGRVSGAALQLAAGSALAALGKGLGMTFSFATYTTLSSTLSVLFGPVGISVAAVAAAFQWSRARPTKALPFVLYMAAARGHLETQNKKERETRSKISRWWRKLTLSS